MKNYYDFLKNEVNNFEGDFDKFIYNLPELFKLLCDLLEEDFRRDDRRLINSALAYFVVPNDVIPDDIYGPMGYVDDIFSCVVVLLEIKEKYGLELLEKLWEGEESIDYVLAYSLRKSYEILKEQDLVNAVLNYAALDLSELKSRDSLSSK